MKWATDGERWEIPGQCQSIDLTTLRGYRHNVRSLLRHSKDATAAFAARQAVNAKLRGIGELTSLSIDSENKKIHALLELAGEVGPIEIEISKYRLDHGESDARLTIEEATASREWLATALQEFVVGQTFPVPARAARLLKLLG